MVEVLSGILSEFPGPANRVRCMAHIVHLVVQVILRQFDVPKSKSKKKKAPAPVNEYEDEVIDSESDDELTKDLDKEELEMDDGDDDGIEDVLDDVENIESAVSEEIAEAAEQVKPVRHVLLKVCFSPTPSLGPCLSHLIPITLSVHSYSLTTLHFVHGPGLYLQCSPATQTSIRNKKLNDYSSTSMEGDSQRVGKVKSQDTRLHDATGCPDPVEFNLRHASLRMHLS